SSGLRCAIECGLAPLVDRHRQRCVILSQAAAHAPEEFLQCLYRGAADPLEGMLERATFPTPDGEGVSSGPDVAALAIAQREDRGAQFAALQPDGLELPDPLNLV